jgi:hypothetical protein
MYNATIEPAASVQRIYQMFFRGTFTDRKQIVLSARRVVERGITKFSVPLPLTLAVKLFFWGVRIQVEDGVDPLDESFDVLDTWLKVS